METTKKSLKKYFSKLKVSDSNSYYNNDNKSVKETIDYFENNGFKCYRQKTNYIGRNGLLRRGISHIAEQKSTGKTIAFEVDKYSPRDKSIQKLKNFDTDYKIIFLKGVKDESYFINDDIEVITIKLKTEEEIIEEKQELEKAAQKMKMSSISGFSKEEDRKLFDVAYDYLGEMINKYDRFIQYSWLVNAMKRNHAILFELVSKTSDINLVLKKAHNEWEEIYKTKKGLF